MFIKSIKVLNYLAFKYEYINWTGIVYELILGYFSLTHFIFKDEHDLLNVIQNKIQSTLPGLKGPFRQAVPD